MTLRPRWYALAFVGLLVFAWFWNSAFAGLGFMPLDQSVLLDGAWRLHLGQVPWKDFLLSYGLIPQLGQWAFFEVFGVGYDSFIAFGSAQNLLGTLLVVLVARRLLPEQRGLQLLAGLITAFWFQAPSGTPWVEQTAFLFCLAILLLLLPAIGRPRGQSPWGPFLAGILLLLAFLSKQNVAGLFFPIPLLILFLDRRSTPGWLRQSAFYLGGILLAAMAFGLWLYLYADPAQFRSSVFEYPAGMLLPRLMKNLWVTLLGPFLGVGKWPHRLVHLMGLILIMLWLRWRSGRHADNGGDPIPALAVWILLSLILLTNLFHVVTNNSVENNQPFLGLILILDVWLLRQLLDRISLRPVVRVWTSTVAILLLAALVIGRAIKVDATRMVQDLFRGVVFEGHLGRPRWNDLTWARPFRIHGEREIPLEDVRDLLADLERRDQNFFTWPDFQIFYPILGKPDPQPLNFFWKGITYPSRYDETLDRRLLTDLKNNDVRVVVLQTAWFSMHDQPRKLSDFRLVDAWIRTDFREVARYGIFRVLTRANGG